MSAARDQADIDRVLAGDTSAFEGIVRRWQGPLVNLAYRFCRHRGRAEEMAQEAFLRAFPCKVTLLKGNSSSEIRIVCCVPYSTRSRRSIVRLSFFSTFMKWTSRRQP